MSQSKNHPASLNRWSSSIPNRSTSKSIRTNYGRVSYAPYKMPSKMPDWRRPKLHVSEFQRNAAHSLRGRVNRANRFTISSHGRICGPIHWWRNGIRVAFWRSVNIVWFDTFLCLNSANKKRLVQIVESFQSLRMSTLCVFNENKDIKKYVIF